MKKISIPFTYELIENATFTDEEKLLAKEASTALEKSYAPYSNFRVACSVLLKNGELVSGANQEVAAYPVCICAEGVALSTASSQYPNIAIKALFIIAQNKNGLVFNAAPCGVCRQRMIEYEQRFQNEITIYLPASESKTIKIDSAKVLLPLSFTGDKLK